MTKNCHGCTHEAAEPCHRCHKHIPSEESACGFCVRNSETKGHWRRDNFIVYNDMMKILEKLRQKRELGKPEMVQFL